MITLILLTKAFLISCAIVGTLHILLTIANIQDPGA